MKRKLIQPLGREKRRTAAALTLALSLAPGLALAATGDLVTNVATVSSDNTESNFANNAAGTSSTENANLSILTNAAVVTSDNPDNNEPNNGGGVGVPVNPPDTDGDGIPDYKDLDDDNDGIPDHVEDPTYSGKDTDGDGIPDTQDLDSDNDGIPDLIESGQNGGVDTDHDGRIDGPVGLDGIPDSVQNNPDTGITNYPLKDTDGDDVPDFQDLDSDNDGIPDVVESGGSDPDGDGIVGTGTPTDINGDGIPDAVPPGGTIPRDTDGDGVPDNSDLDSDNDGIPDVVESGGPDPDGDGIVGTGTPTDTDGDGIPDIVDGKNGFGDAGNLPPRDTDGDGVPDNRDLDSDNDGIPDVVESGGSDPDGDGIVGTGTPTDTDGDGIPDIVDGENGFGDAGNLPPRDTDGDGVPDNRDLDSDNDGIPDVVESGGSDPDGDGIVGTGTPTDTDGDGIPDIVDGKNGFGDAGNPPPKDTDGDGIPDNRDLDSDNDGINDVIENGGSDPDDDGKVGTGTPTDTDGDGIPNIVDGNPNEFGDSGNIPPRDTDGDGTPDFTDLDSDNDSIPDVVEGGNGDKDTDGDGTITTAEGGGDTDGDGIPDTIDGSPNTWGDSGDPGPPDTDGDGIPDNRDPDSDNNGIPDIVENGYKDFDTNNDGKIDDPTDTDGDGIPDVVDQDPGNFGGTPPTLPLDPTDTDGDGILDELDLDDDNDGIPDTVEEANALNGGDTDGDGIPDFLDLDSDNDGIPDVVEAGHGASDPDGDGRIGLPSDGNTGFGSNGLADVVETTPDSGTANYTVRDTDGDGRPDYVDLDSDNDSISDLSESGNGGLIDIDHDGVVDGPVNSGGLASGVSGGPAPEDTDSDGTPDYRDLDSNNDGTNDITDNGFTNLDGNGDGKIDSTTDPDQDGIPDVLDSKPSVFGGFPVAGGCTQWSTAHPSDTDGDVFPIDQEYAFGGLPTVGNHQVDGTIRREGLTIAKRGTSTDGVNVSFVRPKGRYDVTYTLQGTASLEPATVAWTDIATKPVITDNGDSTETLTWSNTGSLAPLTQDKGFVRLKVETPCHPAGSTTLVQGWSRITIEGARQTYGVNFTSMPVFTGVIGSAAGSSLSIPAAGSGQNLSTYLAEAGATYYVEITDGTAEGHRFDLSGGGEDSLTLNLGSVNNTTGTLPAGLAGSHFVIRKHRTLAEIFPRTEWNTSNSSESADQIHFYNGAGFDVNFNRQGGGGLWASTGGPNANNKVIAPGVGVFVVHAQTNDSNVQLQIGDVRYNDFRRPVTTTGTGLNLVAQGFPLMATPAGLQMRTNNLFTGSNSSDSASQIQQWAGDTAVNTTGYNVNILRVNSTWRSISPPADVTSAALFKTDRAAFVLVRQNNLTWTHPLSWEPLSWVQPTP